MTNTILLKHPIAHKDTVISELTFGRAKIKTIEAIQNAIEQGGELLGSIVTISELTGLPVAVVREIDGEDFVEIAGRVADFLPKPPKSSKDGEG